MLSDAIALAVSEHFRYVGINVEVYLEQYRKDRGDHIMEDNLDYTSSLVKSHEEDGIFVPNKELKNKDNKVTLYIWEKAEERVGHVSLQTYGKNGFYASFFPGQGKKYKENPVLNSVKGRFNFHETTDSEEEGIPGCIKVDLYHLDVMAIKQAWWEEIKPFKIRLVSSDIENDKYNIKNGQRIFYDNEVHLVKKNSYTFSFHYNKKLDKNNEQIHTDYYSEHELFYMDFDDQILNCQEFKDIYEEIYKIIGDFIRKGMDISISQEETKLKYIEEIKKCSIRFTQSKCLKSKDDNSINDTYCKKQEILVLLEKNSHNDIILIIYYKNFTNGLQRITTSNYFFMNFNGEQRCFYEVYDTNDKCNTIVNKIYHHEKWDKKCKTDCEKSSKLKTIFNQISKKNIRLIDGKSFVSKEDINQLKQHLKQYINDDICMVKENGGYAITVYYKNTENNELDCFLLSFNWHCLNYNNEVLLYNEHPFNYKIYESIQNKVLSKGGIVSLRNWALMGSSLLIKQIKNFEAYNCVQIVFHLLLSGGIAMQQNLTTETFSKAILQELNKLDRHYDFEDFIGSIKNYENFKINLEDGFTIIDMLSLSLTNTLVGSALTDEASSSVSRILINTPNKILALAQKAKIFEDTVDIFDAYVLKGDDKRILSLLKQGINPNRFMNGILNNILFVWSGWSVLAYSVYNADKECYKNIVRYLLEKGANPNQRLPKNACEEYKNWTLLAYAVWEGCQNKMSSEVAKALIIYGATNKEKFEYGSQKGIKLLDYAKDHNNSIIIEAAKAVENKIKILESANQGNTEAQCNLGHMYNEGIGVVKDDIKALEWFQKAAENGYAEAQYFLGQKYYFGEGVPQGYSTAEIWFRKAAENGHTEAQCNLGCMYNEGIGVVKDNIKGLEWFQKAAESEHAEAQYFLGQKYYFGEGVTQDYSTAEIWFHKAADNEYAEAQYFLGQRYYFGERVTQDYSTAEIWFLKAAENGHTEAQFDLGDMYNEGIGVVKDDIKALEWFLKAAESEHAEAQYFLGQKYYFGEGVPQDYSKAEIWFQKAADNGHAEAQCNLGYMYACGEAISKNIVNQAEQALKLTIMAARGGVDLAEKRLKTWLCAKVSNKKDKEVSHLLDAMQELSKKIIQSCVICNNWSLLTYSVYYARNACYKNITRCLLEKNADPNQNIPADTGVGWGGWSLLAYAVWEAGQGWPTKMSQDVGKYLIEYGAKYEEGIQYGRYRGWSLLSYAVYYNLDTIAEALLRKGSATHHNDTIPNSGAGKWGGYLLVNYAIKKGYTRMKDLIEKQQQSVSEEVQHLTSHQRPLGVS